MATTAAVHANEFELTRQHMLLVFRGVYRVMGELKRILIDRYGVKFSNKNLSEIIGKIIEVKASEILTDQLGYPVRNASSDQEPDLFFTRIQKPLEVKVTSTTNGWTGGEFSRRPSQYLLCSWYSGDNHFSKYFVAFAHLTKDDWISRMQQGQRFYGPLFPTKKLLEKSGVIYFIGHLKKTPRGAVKPQYEDISGIQETLD